MRDRNLTEALSSINPQNIRMYLSSRGWTLEDRRDTTYLYVNPERNNSVAVPNDMHYLDYSNRIWDIVDTISNQYGESSQTVISDMTISRSSEVIQYRYKNHNNEVGLIPPSDLIMLIEASQDINTYAYRDLIAHSSYYKSSRWDGKKDLESIRIGTTMPGSYIIQVIYPGLDDDKSIQSDIYGAPTYNSVMNQLCDKIIDSMDVVVEAAERNKTEIDEESKISYNFVSSMMKLKMQSTDIDIRRTRKKGISEDSSPVILTENIFSRIERIEQSMKPPEMDVEKTFVGKIVDAHDTRENGTDGIVKLKIKYINDSNTISTASFTITGDDIQKAYTAMNNRVNVKITGTLGGNDRNRRIEGISEFKILD